MSIERVNMQMKFFLCFWLFLLHWASLPVNLLLMHACSWIVHCSVASLVFMQWFCWFFLGGWSCRWRSKAWNSVRIYPEKHSLLITHLQACPRRIQNSNTHGQLARYHPFESIAGAGSSGMFCLNAVLSCSESWSWTSIELNSEHG